ncbi:hypothetical protein HYPSUDRAFT_216004 [Hypholoma sublateritium FD-334 SS-4]|uniref:Uncharacterized protein n=1 Tax=Hypholoma sublateritium (strain FD-334 SS-4) TaxID=945553 RepID=A0A0D2NZW6_HYPSF|nr:hypothetical protein HYPSUDRAFT_216004 [Hypholoma sublateritium FD-334 SS-4]
MKARTKGVDPFEIIAAGCYPSVLTNLARNVHANFLGLLPPVNYLHRASRLGRVPRYVAPNSPSLQAPLDVVFGANIVSEVLHASWLRDVFATLLRRPTLATKSRTVEEVFACAVPSTREQTARVIRRSRL